MATIIDVAPPTGDAQKDMAAIDAAIKAANAAYLQNQADGQVTVKLAVGTYSVAGDPSNSSKGGIELLSGVLLTGEGSGATTIRLVDNFDARINGIVRTALGDVSNVSVQNLTIDGNRANNTTGDPLKDHQAGFICGDKNNVQSNITLSGVEIKDCTAYGFNPHEVTQNVVIENCVSHGNGLDGFVADGVVGGTYSKNIAYDNDRHGFNIQNASTNIDLVNNIAHDNGSAGVTIQRGDIAREGQTTIDWVTNIRIVGGEYYGNTKEGVLVKLSSNVTIDGASIHNNETQGVRIEGSVGTIVQNSEIFNNAQLADDTYDEINIRLRDDTSVSGHIYYSTGTQILNNDIYSNGAINSRWGVREEPTNDDGGPTGTYLSGNTYSGMDTGSVSVPGQPNPITGTTGDDTINGSAGGEEMHGLAGNDTYIVNHSSDVVVENPNEGNDTVLSSITHTLGPNVENLTLTGTNPVNGYGNELNNAITGNSANNVLKSFAGNDTLDGGAGADIMTGGDGNDVYYVDNIGDVVQESANGGLGGTDRVYSSISYTLPAQVEELVLTGSGNINATGNTAANLLVGNSGNNVLDGAGGADTMSGGLGDDTYFVDHTGDVVIEQSGAGTDQVVSSVSYTLGLNVENLTLTGTTATLGVGNELDNLIIGNSAANKLSGGGGNDTLDGGLGADTLFGGSGNDVFILRKGELNGDVISDFVGNGAAAGDRIEFSGFSSQATLTRTGTDTWTVTDGSYTESFRITGVTSLDPSDYSFRTNGPSNLPPTAVTLTQTLLEVTENVDYSAGIKVADVAVSDDGLGSNTLALIGADAGSFELRGTELFFIGKADYEAKASYSVAVTADDPTLGTGIEATSATFTLAVHDVNEWPPNTILGTAGADHLVGGAAAEWILGFAGNDALWGFAGNDTLDGGTGADVMTGGLGNDVYYVDNARDRVVETSTGGTADIVYTSVSYGLAGTYVERLYALGSDAISLTGNSLNNVIVGNTANNVLVGGAGNDILNGGAGADVMVGGTGNDTYYVDNARDRAVETSNGGTDLVYTTASYSLGGTYVERLYAQGTGALTLTGNSLANIIKGNGAANKINGGAGNDYLYGGAGNDLLWGGSGQDKFMFNTAPNSRTNKDTIKDWNYRDDTVVLENAIFKALKQTGTLNKAYFTIGAGAKDGNDFVGYNSKTGDLWYDSNGNKAGGQVTFANIGANKHIDYNDFLII